MWENNYYSHRLPEVMIREIDQILMIHICVSSRKWPRKVRGAVLHLWPLKIWELKKVLTAFKITKDKNARRNKMLPFFEQNRENILTFTGFCCLFWPTSSFLRGFEGKLLQTSQKKKKIWKHGYLINISSIPRIIWKACAIFRAKLQFSDCDLKRCRCSRKTQLVYSKL